MRKDRAPLRSCLHHRSPDGVAITSPTPSGPDTANTQRDLPTVVGVGASAGGLDAFTRLLHGLSPDAGLVYVLVQHLAPDHESFLPELLGRATKIPVVQAVDGMRVEPAHDGSRHFVVLFEDESETATVEAPSAKRRGGAGRKAKPTRTNKAIKASREVEQLHDELAATKRHLVEVVEQHAATVEELRAAGEDGSCTTKSAST